MRRAGRWSYRGTEADRADRADADDVGATAAAQVSTDGEANSPDVLRGDERRQIGVRLGARRRYSSRTVENHLRRSR